MSEANAEIMRQLAAWSVSRYRVTGNNSDHATRKIKATSVRFLIGRNQKRERMYFFGDLCSCNLCTHY